MVGLTKRYTVILQSCFVTEQVFRPILDVFFYSPESQPIPRYPILEQLYRRPQTVVRYCPGLLHKGFTLKISFFLSNCRHVS